MRKLMNFLIQLYLHLKKFKMMWPVTSVQCSLISVCAVFVAKSICSSIYISIQCFSMDFIRGFHIMFVRDRLQISPVILNEFKGIDQLLFPLEIISKTLMISGGIEVNYSALTGPPALARRVLSNRVCPSFRLSVCPGELYHQFFLNFGMMLETHMKLCVTEPHFPEIFFCPKIWENGPKMDLKQGFFEYIEKFCH